jgi:hypothetical protein
MKDNLRKLFKNIDCFLDLPNSSVSKANELGEKICKGAKELQNTVRLGPRVQKKLEQLTSKLENISTRLSRSILNSNQGTFKRDWVRFARAESIKLKDEVLALREFLTLNADAIGRSLKEIQCISLEELPEILREEQAIHEITYAKLTKRLSAFSRRELRKQEREAGEHLTRISGWLSSLREIRQVKMDVAKAEG